MRGFRILLLKDTFYN